MLTPPYLKAGNRVAIVATSRWIDQDKYSAIVQQIENRGFLVVRGESTYLQHGIFAGTDTQRAADLQQMIDDESISAIFCVRGGYGAIRMVDKVDFSSLKKSPKWIIGFSDITVLHSKLNLLGIESIHGQMPVNFASQENNCDVDKLFDALTGTGLNYQWQPNAMNHIGQAKGELCGGNLSIICSLMGTPYQIDTTNKILFIEDVCEPLYRIDRMMQQLKAAGALDKLSGLVVGYFTNAEDSTPSFEMGVEQIILDAVGNQSYPIAFNFSAGHERPNYPLIFGRYTQLNVSQLGSELIFEKCK